MLGSAGHEQNNQPQGLCCGPRSPMLAVVSFSDHFSGHARSYSEFRPSYPAELYQFLASMCVHHGKAWDVATGSGQAAVALTDHFRTVVATDASRQQILNAKQHARVEYDVCPAELSPLASSSVDLVTVAQAVHWFDFDRFYAEVRRVARGGARIALWTYGVHRVSAEIDPIMHEFYAGTIGRYWPPERDHIEAGYASIPFPFEPIRAPAFEMSAHWSLDALLGYVGTWSAVKRYQADQGTDPMPQLKDALQPLWGDQPRLVRWPLTLKLGAV